ncbi:MAG: hypothetical protein RPR91_07490, partial [Colwellia sp.]
IIESYLPEPDPETGEIDPASLPDTLPGYLINLKAEFSIGDQVVATANVGTMGTELHEKLGYFDPRFGWDLSSNKPTAGEYQAIGLDLQGTSTEYAARLQADLESTKAKLESGDENQLASLTKQALVGDMLESTIFSYFAMNNIQDDIAAQQAGIVNYRAPSYGKFSTSLTTSYFFGTPRNVSASGLAMDVDKVFNTIVDKNNDSKNWINYNQMIGARLSAMEHLIPEQMFSTPEASAQGISAVKAIAIASSEGQKIWTITKVNVEAALAEITLSADTETEIRNSANAGMVITTHEKRLNYNGWIGGGYIILDPQTGAGAYKIAGGGNGSDTKVPEAISEVTKWGGIFSDIILEGLKNSDDIASKAFKFFLKSVSKLLSSCSNFIGNSLAIFGILENCPLEAIALVLPMFIFLLVLATALTFLLSGLVFVFFGILSGIVVGGLATGAISACKKE